MKKAGTVLVVLTLVFCIFCFGFLMGRNLHGGDVTVSRSPSGQEASSQETTEATSFRKVDINHATADELTLLPGIGTKLAQRIVDYRSSVGLFKSVEDLGNVEGIGDQKLLDIMDYVTIGGST